MSEHSGNVDTSTRIRRLMAELSEWERDAPIELEIVGKPQKEIMRLVMEDKERLEVRLRIIGQNFPGVHEDARNVVVLTQRLAKESSPASKLEMYQMRDATMQAYKEESRKELRPVFILVLGDFLAYETISWNH